MRDDLQFRRVGAGILQFLHAPVQFPGFLHGAADGAVAGPGDMTRDQAEMSDDGNAFAGHGFDDERTGGAVHRTGPGFERAETYPDRLLRRSQSVRGGRGEETVGRGSHEGGQARLGLRTVETAAHEIDSGLGRSGSFLRGFDVDVCQDPLAFELLEVVNGVFFAGAEHEAGEWVGSFTKHRKRP